MKSQCSVFIMKSVVWIQFIAESLVNHLTKEIQIWESFCIKNFDRSYIYMYYILLSLVLQIYIHFFN